MVNCVFFVTDLFKKKKKKKTHTHITHTHNHKIQVNVLNPKIVLYPNTRRSKNIQRVGNVLWTPPAQQKIFNTWRRSGS